MKHPNLGKPTQRLAEIKDAPILATIVMLKMRQPTARGCGPIDHSLMPPEQAQYFSTKTRSILDMPEGDPLSYVRYKTYRWQEADQAYHRQEKTGKLDLYLSFQENEPVLWRQMYEQHIAYYRHLLKTAQQNGDSVTLAYQDGMPVGFSHYKRQKNGMEVEEIHALNTAAYWTLRL
jgi:hypothetical protein